MGDHKKLPPQPIHAQYGLHQFQEKGSSLFRIERQKASMARCR